MGKIYEDLSDYSRSFEYFEQGNQIARAGYDYSHDENAALFSSIENVFEQRLFQGYEGAGCDSDIPIFILSMPRSGSTLLEQMLAAHRKVYGAGELLLLPGIIHSLWTKYVAPKGTVFPVGAATLSSKVLRGAGEHYINMLRGLVDQKDIIRVTDKFPLNFMNVGVIKQILPNARIIHCYRDPVDTCLSCFKQRFSAGHRYAYNLEELGGFYKLYQELMDHWHKVLPGHILDVEYESLVDDQAGQLKRILEFCGLPWDDACLMFHESDRAAMTASSIQVKKPLYRSGIGYWRHYEDHLKPLLDVLGRNSADG